MEDFTNALGNMGLEVEDYSDTTKKIGEESKDAGLDTFVSEEEERISRERGLITRLTEADRDLAVQLQIVPKAYRNAVFNEEKIKDNLKELYYNPITRKLSKKVYKFSEYIEICNGILSSIRMRQLPTRSYIIGAPNSFGKTSFVNECLITLLKNGFRVVPYLSLEELAHIKTEYESKVLKPMLKENDRFLIKNSDGVFERVKTDNDEYRLGSEYVRKAKEIHQQYSYYDYMNADCLFVKLSSQTSKEVESYTLFQLLSIRADKGLPTIVMMPFSMDIYKKDKLLKEYVWDEITTEYEKENCYDRLYHVSCYSRQNLGELSNKGEKIDVNTGIVEN